MGLKRELNLFTATLYGIGIILGAGIYVLIGQGAALAGNALWMSFLIAALIATCTGLSYAELAGMFPRNAAEYVYTKKAFNSETLSFVVEWAMLLAVIFSVTTVALGFSKYFSFLFGGNEIAISIGLIAILTAINYRGIKESARFNVVSTFIELAGLLIVIAVGSFFIGRNGIDLTHSPMGLEGILSATSLIFFAYIGFENLVNFSEETRNAKKIIPKALVISLLVSTALYMLVSIASVSVIGYERLGASQAPLTEVVSAAIPNSKILMSLIALFATANTVLAMLIVGSRMTHGLSVNKVLPQILSKVGRRGTPYNSIIIVSSLSILFMGLGGIKTVALMTDVGIFLVYVFINMSVIWLRFRNPYLTRTFKSPLSIGRMPVIALVGVASSAFMLFRFEPKIILYEILVIVAGFAIYKLFNHRR